MYNQNGTMLSQSQARGRESKRLSAQQSDSSRTSSSSSSTSSNKIIAAHRSGDGHSGAVGVVDGGITVKGACKEAESRDASSSDQEDICCVAAHQQQQAI